MLCASRFQASILGNTFSITRPKPTWSTRFCSLTLPKQSVSRPGRATTRIHISFLVSTPTSWSPTCSRKYLWRSSWSPPTEESVRESTLKTNGMWSARSEKRSSRGFRASRRVLLVVTRKLIYSGKNSNQWRRRIISISNPPLLILSHLMIASISKCFLGCSHLRLNT